MLRDVRSLIVKDNTRSEVVCMSSVITFTQKGNFKNLNKFLERAKEGINVGILDKHGREGVIALANATPVDTSITAQSWYYKIERNTKNGQIKLNFYNSHVDNGCPIAIILQYGHATKNGGWVEGRDYINPAIRPIFDKIVNEAWKEITK